MSKDVRSGSPTTSLASSGGSSSTPATGSSILPQKEFPQPTPRPPSVVGNPTTIEALTAASASSYEYFTELVQKRVTTFSYLKRTHEGRIHWFNTVCLTREDLGLLYDNARMKKRTVNFFILGVSLSPILDITNPPDYVKALAALLQEFEHYSNEHSKQKMKMLFRKSKIKHEEDRSFQETGEYTYLYVPNIPFDLDYFQTFYTLCDILVEVYNKFLVGTANSWTTSLTESVLKIDGKFKKIIALVTKEIDSLARTTIKDELRSIDPMIMMSSAVTTSPLSARMNSSGSLTSTNTAAASTPTTASSTINGSDSAWDGAWLG